MIILKYTHNEAIWCEDRLINWDAGQYYRIVYKGYNDYLVAFFPLFPFMWKLLGCGVYGIVFFNAILFTLSASMLATVFGFSTKEFLLMLSFPSLIFMFLPYTEAVFFFSTSLILVGMKKNHNWLIFIGMLLASCARPVVYVFIPAVLIILFITQNKHSIVQKLVFYILPVLLGLAIVICLQYFNTHDWLAFFHSQKTGWNNYLRLPKLILTSWGGDNIVRLDGSAFLVGVIATITLGFLVLKKSFVINSMKQEAILFSILYLAGICWLILSTRGGSLFSLNRFVFATAFFFIAFSAFIKRTWKTKEYVFIFFLFNAFWLLFGSYVHIQETLKYLALSVFLTFFLFISHSNKHIARTAYLVCLFGNIILQVYCYYYFLNGGWIA